MSLLFILLLLEVLLWLVLVALHSVRLVPSGISDYEMQRRVKTGDEQALFLQQRDQALPDVRALKFVLEVLLMIIFIATMLATFEWWIAVPLLVVALMYLEGATRWAFVAKPAQNFYEKYETNLLTFTRRWHKVIKWLRGPQGHVPGQFVYTKEELLERLKTTHGVVSRDELLLMQHSLSFGEKLVGDIMTPRSVIDAVEAKDTLGPVVLNHLHGSGHSRFPVYEKDIDHVVGMLYVKDLVPLKKNMKHVRDAMHHEVYYVREDQDLEHALAAFLRTHHHLLVVVNEYRETVGLLSLEDVLEALLGRKIIDEFDQHEDLRAVAERNPRHNNLPTKRKDV